MDPIKLSCQLPLSGNTDPVKHWGACRWGCTMSKDDGDKPKADISGEK